jgi:hypothetical protein
MRNIALLIVCAALAAAPVRAQEYVGYVVRVTGNWRLEAARDPAHPVKVVRWQEVSSGSRFTPSGGAGEVSLWLVDGGVRTFDASQPDTWKQPVTLSAPPQSASDKWIALAMRWLSAKPQLVVPAMARTAREVEPLRDQVVAWSAAGIDAEALLGAAARQPLVLRFEPLSAEGQPISEGAAIVDWDPVAGRKPPIAVKPGLYRVVALDPEGLRPGQEAWILAVPEAEFPAATGLFQDLVRVAAPWAKDDARSARGFLRGALLSLAGERPAK